ncbi:MAG: TonB-dependent receptor [Pseudomonadota bacterium]|nr:TonB-dependent receptor [Pseudomonadota bacterium]
MATKPKKLKLTLAASILALLSSQATGQETTAAAPETADDETWRIDEVVVHGLRLGDGTNPAIPLQVLSGDEFAHRRQGTLGETLEGLPGIHMDKFGGGASRPVIRGQTVPRIEILSDSATVFDASSASPDHAITTDPLLLDAIEILRGPAAAIYGGNAQNGAINLIDSKVPKALPEDGLDGATELRYGTGDEETSLAARATLGLAIFAFHAEGSSHDSDDYDVPGVYGSDELRDSFASSSSYSVGASWITGKGYAGVAYTVQDAEYGLPGHSHKNAVCHTHGTDLHCAAHGGFEDPFGSPDDHTALIDLRSERVDVRADYEGLLPWIDRTRVRLSYTDYAHDEIDGPSTFAQYANEVYNGRIELTHMPVFGFTGIFGVEYTDGTFRGINVNDLHEDFPENGWGFDGESDYKTENVGIFLNERRSIGKVDFEIGARKDWREIDVTMPEFRIQLSPQHQQIFQNFYGDGWRDVIASSYIDRFIDNHPSVESEPLSASVGATWNYAEGYSAALSLSHTERAPSVRELYAYGNNLATNSYEVGLVNAKRASSQFPESPNDVLETANSINLTFRKFEGPTHFEISVFHQDFEDYVFARLIETDSETGLPHNYLLYVAADAAFTGIDGQLSHQLTPASTLTVFGDYVHTELSGEDDNLPRIPPARFGARYDWAKGPLKADVELYRTLDQDRFASYETETEGYDMLNATLAYTLERSGSNSVEFYVRGTNLLDELALVHTSFVKDQSPLRGRNFVFGIRQEF